MKQTAKARVVHLGTADTRGSFITRAVAELPLVLGGIDGDRHFGLTRKAGVREKHHPRGVEIANVRQLSIVSVEELAEVSARLGIAETDWTKLGANLVLEGLPRLTQLAPSSRLVFPSGACVVVDSENAPCVHPARALEQPGFVKAAVHLRGLVGWVERVGAVRVGDAVVVWSPA
ncbi:MAG: MOSC domain-containing protein [Myxococcaceae bacterium]|nr:MOSC domain-containing protein [Myxococcaceae bacterium]